MIPLNFFLLWAGGKMSYLRYLTFKSLRHYHPDSKIQLHVSQKYNPDIHSWGCEKQDFEGDVDGKNYIDLLKDIGVDVINHQYIVSPDLDPILQTDIGRWLLLREYGGVYLDTDQLILRSFGTLPLHKEFVYCSYAEKQCGEYWPVGVLALEKNSAIADVMIEYIRAMYSPNNYNSSGPVALKYASRKMNLSRSFNAPYYYFYPVNSSADVGQIYNGTASLHGDAFSLHWFGGHGLSQKFNAMYTEEFAKTSLDTISARAREDGIL